MFGPIDHLGVGRQGCCKALLVAVGLVASFLGFRRVSLLLVSSSCLILLTSLVSLIQLAASHLTPVSSLCFTISAFALRPLGMFQLKKIAHRSLWHEQYVGGGVVEGGLTLLRRRSPHIINIFGSLQMVAER